MERGLIISQQCSLSYDRVTGGGRIFELESVMVSSPFLCFLHFVFSLVIDLSWKSIHPVDFYESKASNGMHSLWDDAKIVQKWYPEEIQLRCLTSVFKWLA
ncbi:hypothetical protein Dimus_022501 [Dionaea muscipula]